MATVPQQQGLPFVVEPVSSQQVQLWAAYAGQVLTQPGFSLVSSAFDALWWQAAASDCYQSASRLLGFDASSVVFYLDMIVNELRNAMESWARVVSLMGECQGQWIEDAMQQVQRSLDLRQAAASQVAIWCDTYQLALPESTQALFAEMQSKGF